MALIAEGCRLRVIDLNGFSRDVANVVQFAAMLGYNCAYEPGDKVQVAYECGHIAVAVVLRLVRAIHSGRDWMKLPCRVSID